MPRESTESIIGSVDFFASIGNQASVPALLAVTERAPVDATTVIGLHPIDGRQDIAIPLTRMSFVPMNRDFHVTVERESEG